MRDATAQAQTPVEIKAHCGFLVVPVAGSQCSVPPSCSPAGPSSLPKEDSRGVGSGVGGLVSSKYTTTITWFFLGTPGF